jgi:hypothetical protein
MDRSCNATELHMFIGCVSYYRDMGQSCLHVLKPLTDQPCLKKKTPIKWTDEIQQAFDKIRLFMAANALAAYPNHNKWFDIHTDASDFQLGACIIQEGRTVAYFLRKLTNYSKTMQPWKRKCFPLSQLSKVFKVCSSV